MNEFFLLKLPDNGRDLDMHPDLRQLAVAHSDQHIRLFGMFKKA